MYLSIYLDIYPYLFSNESKIYGILVFNLPEKRPSR